MRLDAQLDAASRAELAAWIREQYTIEMGDIPLGMVSQCGLGPPYVDHRLDLYDNIIDHFSPADTMPDPFSRARALAQSGAYAYVEVYESGDVIPVGHDGRPINA